MIFVILFIIADFLVKVLVAIMSTVTFIPAQAFSYAQTFLQYIYPWSWLVPIQTVLTIVGILIGIVYAEFIFHSTLFFFWLARNTINSKGL